MIRAFCTFGFVIGATWCSAHDDSHPASRFSAYSPVGKTAYMTSSFSENRGTRYHAGIDWSTEMQEGWPVLAPEDGVVIQLRQSPFNYGKNLMFRGKSGFHYLFAHLSGFQPKLDSAFEAQKLAQKRNDLEWFPVGAKLIQYRAKDTIAFTGSTGIGNPHLHVELRDSTTTVVLNPCDHGFVCSDTIAPQVLGAIVWDAIPGNAISSMTSAQSLQNGCLEVDPQIREPRLAIKIVDYSREPRENPMSIYELTLREGLTPLFHRAYVKQTYGKMGRIRDELLWSEEGLNPGDWHFIGLGADTNDNVDAADMKRLGRLLREGSILSKKGKILSPLQLDVSDFVNHKTSLALNAKPSCASPTDTTMPKLWDMQDSVVFSFVSRTWINLRVCDAGIQLRLKDEAGKLLKESLCKTEPHRIMPLSSVFGKWPKARRLDVVSAGTALTRQIHIAPLPMKVSGPVKVNGGGVSMELVPYPSSYENALAWEFVDSLQDSVEGVAPAWVLHPKGLHLYGKGAFCVNRPDEQDKRARLYWLGETSRLWFIFSKQTPDSLNQKVCMEMDEMRDLAFQVDTTPPVLGAMRDTLAMVRGKSVPVIRIPVYEPWAGIPDGSAFEASVNGKWIPIEFDSEPSELVLERRWLKAGSPVLLKIRDELGNQTTVQLQVQEQKPVPVLTPVLQPAQ